jgi:hypothetical protein
MNIKTQENPEHYLDYEYGGAFRQKFNSNFNIESWESIKGKKNPTKIQNRYNELMNEFLRKIIKNDNNEFHLTVNTKNSLIVCNISEILRKFQDVGRVFKIVRHKIKDNYTGKITLSPPKVVIPWTEFSVVATSNNKKTEKTIEQYTERWKPYWEEKVKFSKNKKEGKKELEHYSSIPQRKIDSEKEIDNSILNIEKSIEKQKIKEDKRKKSIETLNKEKKELLEKKEKLNYYKSYSK